MPLQDQDTEQQPQTGADTYASMVQAMQQGAQAQGPSGPAGPAANPIMQQLLDRSMETEGDAMTRLKRMYYGMAEGQAAPTKGQKAKTGILEVLKALTQNNYQNPRERMQAIIDKQYPAESQRLGIGANLAANDARLNNTYQMAQDKIAQQQAALESLNAREKAKLEEKAAKDKDLGVARDRLNNIRQQGADGLTTLHNAEAALAEKRAAILEYKLKHPEIKAGQLYDEFTEGKNYTDKEKLEIFQLVHMNPMASLGTTSGTYADENGLKHNFSNKILAGQGLLGGLSLLNKGASGAPAAQPGNPLQPPQAQVAPDASGVPAAAPAPGPVAMPSPAATPAPVSPGEALKKIITKPAAATPKAPGAPNSQSLMDLTDPANPLPPGRYPPDLIAKRNATASKREEGAKKIDSYELTANSGLDNMTNAILTGKAKDFQGVVASNPFFSAMRRMFGTKSDNETMQMLQNLDTLYGKLGANIRGRFTVPEIAGHLQAMASPSATPENAVMALGALKLQANMQQMFERGKISAKDAPAVQAMVRNELNRLQNNLKTITPEERQAASRTGQNPTRFSVKSLDQLMQDRKGVADAHGLHESSGGPSIEDVRAEMARRAAAKKK